MVKNKTNYIFKYFFTELGLQAKSQIRFGLKVTPATCMFSIKSVIGNNNNNKIFVASRRRLYIDFWAELFCSD